MQTRRRIEPSHGRRCFNTLKAAIANQAANDGAVLLLDKGLVVLLVGARPRTAPGNDDVVHEGHQPALTRKQRSAFGPAGCHIDHSKDLDERFTPVLAISYAGNNFGEAIRGVTVACRLTAASRKAVAGSSNCAEPPARYLRPAQNFPAECEL